MSVSKEKLLKSGFTNADIQKLHNNIANYGGSLDSVTHDLANRFRASKWITIVALIVLVLTSVLSSKNNALSLGFALLVGLPFIWYIAPAKLAYKAWRYQKNNKD